MSVDYTVFNEFCHAPTWNTSHPSDERAFMQALRQVVNKPNFSAEAMGEYIKANAAKPMWPKTPEEIDQAIEGLVRDAEAVRTYERR